jgi:periplasmic protein TonB
MRYANWAAAMIAATGAALAAPAHAGSAGEQRVYIYAIELDRNGQVQRLARHSGPGDAVARQLEARIGDWIFAGARRDGQAVATSSYLRVVVEPSAQNDGGPRLVSVTTGPAPASLTMPAFPVSDQRAGMSGSVVLKLRIDAAGRVERADVHDTAGNVSRAMANSALASAMQWRFRTETVDGQPVAGTVLWPVCFLGKSSDATVCGWEGPDAQRYSSKTVLALEPAARVVSEGVLADR